MFYQQRKCDRKFRWSGLVADCENGYLKMLPCISKEWKEYEIQYKYKTSIYKIKVKNLNKKNTGVEKFLIDGKEIKEKQILLQDNCKIYNIEIFM